MRAQGWSLVAQELDEGRADWPFPSTAGPSCSGLNVSVQPGRVGSASISDEMVPLMRKVANDIANDFGGRIEARS